MGAGRAVLGLVACAASAALLAAACERRSAEDEATREGYLRTAEVAPWDEGGPAVELDPGCGELGPPELVLLGGLGHDVRLLPAGCTFRMRVDAPAGGEIALEVALHPFDVTEIAAGGLVAPRLVFGIERDGDPDEQHCIDFESNLLSDPLWRRRRLAFAGGDGITVFGRVEPTDGSRRHARVALGSFVVTAKRREPWPIEAAAAPMPSAFAERAPADVDAEALWERWSRNRAVFSAALAGAPSAALADAVLAAAADQERSFAEFVAGHSEESFWRLWELVPGAGDSRPGARPDLVLVVVDCARRDHLSAYGYPRPTTPEIDALLAAPGVVFTDAYSTGSATNYSMPSMMTSRYPTQHRFQRRKVLAAAERTVAEELRDAGYLTLGVATNPFLGPGSGLEQGFLLYDSREREYVPYPRAESATARAAELAVVLRWMPTFLYVHLMDAHGPYRPGPPFDRAFDGVRYTEEDELRNLRASPPYLANETFARPPEERAAYVGVDRLETLYDANLRYLDEQLGRFLRSLAERGLLDDAAVLLTADHGEEFLEHGLTYHDSVPHEEKVRIPLVLKPHAGWAGPRAVRVDRPVDAVLGVLPTLLELAGIPVPPGTHGRSVLDESGANEPIFHDNGWVRAVRDGPWKLIVANRGAASRFPEFRVRGDPAELLFRLDVDPGERTNLIASEPERARELRALLDARFDSIAAAARAEDDAAPAPAPVDATRRSRLRALGYAE